jgi:hypothetical protein
MPTAGAILLGVLNLVIKVKDLIKQLQVLDPETPIVAEYFTPGDFIELEPSAEEFIAAASLSQRYMWDGAMSVLEETIEAERGGL